MNGHACMNRSYTLVWSDVLQAYQVVPETARRHGKSSQRTALRPLVQACALALLMAGAPLTPLRAQTQPSNVVPASGNTKAYVSANGVTVVNIATTNAAGVSHNVFGTYNVDPKGLVLNNGNLSKVTRQSQLAGQVASNVNLNKEARVIINEVVSTNRSLLNGFTEVLGGKADVVVANPNGITCSGCGFINTDRVTLSTGTPTWTSGGDLSGFLVNRGDILVNGDGLNASTQQVLDLVSRSVKVQSKINARDLGITTGANNWNYQNREVQNTTRATGATPEYAIDASQLGSMYASRIRVIATEAGVGVRMQTDMAATAGEFILNAQGRVQLSAKVSASTNMDITTTSTNDDALTITDGGQVTAAGNLALKSAVGGLSLTGGTIYAGQNLSVEARTLEDRSSDSIPTGDTNQDVNKRFGHNSLSLKISDAASIDGVNWLSTGDFSGQFGGLTLGASGQTTLIANGAMSLTSTASDQNMVFGAYTLLSASALTVSSAHGVSLWNNGASKAQLRSRDIGGITLKAASQVNNEGDIAASSGQITIATDKLDNTGSVHAGTEMHISGLLPGSAASLVSNEGQVLVDGVMTVKAKALTNLHWLQANHGAYIESDEVINTGTLILGLNDAAPSTLRVKSLDNHHMMASQGGLNISGVANAPFSVVNHGNILASDLLRIGDDGASSSTVTLMAGSTMEAGQLELTAQDLSLSGATASAEGALMSSRRDMTVNVQSLSMGASCSLEGNANCGKTARILGAMGEADGPSDYTTTINISSNSLFNNEGLIHSGGALLLTAESIDNSANGGISALRFADLEVNSFSNHGSVYVNDVLFVNADHTFTNDKGGQILAGDMYLNADDVFVNKSNIQADVAIDITARKFTNDLDADDLTKQWTSTTLSETPRPFDHWNIDTERDFQGAQMSWSFCQANPTSCPPSVYIYHNLTRVTQEKETFKGLPEGTFAPQITAGASLSIHFQTGSNKGGKLTGPEVMLTGTNAQPTFEFVSYTLGKREMSWTVKESKQVQRDEATDTWRDVADTTILTVPNQPDNITGLPGVQYGGIYADKLSLRDLNVSITATGPAGAATLPQPVTPTRTSTTLPNAANFPGLSIVLPSNPNGFYVTATDPSARYLVESNPLYGEQSVIGSSYLIELLNYDPDKVQKRLGDDAYESQLLRQQLIEQTGNRLLHGYADEQEQNKSLMSQAVTQSQALGLTWGQPLTADQVGQLKQDIVWMVEVEVAGQKVLTPVVYLSAATREQVAGQGVIAARNIQADVASFTNTNATISATEKMDIKTGGDLVNRGGTLKGGDVSLSSTGGSIRNETEAITLGPDGSKQTIIGQTGRIISTGNLSMQANKDIVNKGAQVTAGGDASLQAGRNVTFDTIENVNTTTTTANAKDEGGHGKGSVTTTTTTVTQVKSGLNTGGNLTVKSGKDTTFAGTNVTAKGDANLQAGGQLQLIARENAVTTHSESKVKGVGVGGALYGTETIVTDSTSRRNQGSTLNVGGSANLKAAQDITVQGSTVNVTKGAQLDATNVNVLAGVNSDTSTTTRTTTGILKVTGSNQVGEDPDKAAANGEASGNASASAEKGSNYASAEAQAAGSATGKAAAGLALHTETTKQTTTLDSTSVASTLNVGGDLKVKAKDAVNIQGSNVSTDQNLDIKAQSVNVTTGENRHESTTTQKTTAVGFLGSTDNTVKGGAEAKAGASTPNASASVNVDASAATQNRLALGEVTIKNASEKDVTNVGSSIRAGQNLSVTADKTLAVTGSNLQSGQDMTLQATDIQVVAAKDTHTRTESTSKTSIGLYADAKAQANASAKAGASPLPQAGASVSASVDAALGVYGTNTTTKSQEEIALARGSSIAAGGNLTRTAKEGIKDVGTQIRAGGDVTQSAKTIESLAASNTYTASSSTMTNTGKLSTYEGAGYEGSAKGGLTNTGTKSDTSVAMGVRVEYEFNKESTDKFSSQAVASTIVAKGNVSSKSQQQTTLEGTKIEAGKAVTLEASSLDYKAARNISNESSSKLSGNAAASVNVLEKSATVGLGMSGESTFESQSKAKAGSISAGQGISVKTTEGNLRLEGTHVATEGRVDLDAKSNLIIDAARDTASSKKITGKADVEVTGSIAKQEFSGKVSAEGSTSTSSSDKESGARILGAQGVNLKSGQDTTLTGTNIASRGNINVDAGGNLNVLAARDVQKSSDVSVGASIDASKGETHRNNQDVQQQGGQGSLTVNVSKAESDVSTGATLSSAGGNISLKSGKDMTLVGTQGSAAGTISTEAKGQLTQKAAESSSKSTKVGIALDAEGNTPSGKQSGAAQSWDFGKTKGGAGGVAVEVDVKKESSAQAVNLTANKGVKENGQLLVKTRVAIPKMLPPGKQAAIQTKNGKPLPDWLKFNPKTGEISGKVPPDFKGTLDLVVKVPQMDGSVKNVPVRVGQ